MRPMVHPRIAEFHRGKALSAEDRHFTLTDEDREAIAEMQQHFGCEALLKALRLKHGKYLRQWYSSPNEDFAQAIQLKARCAQLDEVIRLITDKPKPKEKDNAEGS